MPNKFFAQEINAEVQRQMRGDRVEHNPATRKYMIYRPATPERAAVHYDVSEWDMMKIQGELKLSNEDMTHHILFDENIDAWLRPIQRRALVAHTRRKLGL